MTYTVTATNTGAVDYTADAPATVFDDLSGVLDDATYRNDASADAPGDLGYSEHHLSWSAPPVRIVVLRVGSLIVIDLTNSALTGLDTPLTRPGTGSSGLSSSRWGMQACTSHGGR